MIMITPRRIAIFLACMSWAISAIVFTEQHIEKNGSLPGWFILLFIVMTPIAFFGMRGIYFVFFYRPKQYNTTDAVPPAMYMKTQFHLERELKDGISFIKKQITLCSDPEKKVVYEDYLLLMEEFYNRLYVLNDKHFPPSPQPINTEQNSNNQSTNL